MNMYTGPAKPEQTYWKHKSCQNRKGNSCFWYVLPSRFFDALLVVSLLPTMCDRTDQHANRHTQIQQSNLDGVESMSHFAENERESAIEEKYETEDVSVICSCKHDDRLGKE